MWWYGRGNSGGSWLPEEKKAKMWHGRGNSGGSWLPAFPRSCRPQLRKLSRRNCHQSMEYIFLLLFSVTRFAVQSRVISKEIFRLTEEENNSRRIAQFAIVCNSSSSSMYNFLSLTCSGKQFFIVSHISCLIGHTVG